MTIDTKAIRAAAEAATPGPWHAAGPSFGMPLPKYINCVIVENEDGDADDICIAPIGCDEISTEDLTYIATANPATVIALLDRLEAAETEVLEQARLLGIGGEKELALMAKLEAAEKEIQLVRNAALEEAAQVCEVNHHTVRPSPDSFECAAGIRCLKS